MKLGERILYLRRQGKMSQEQLAEKVLVSRQAVSKWELGESLPDVDNIVQLSNVFGVTTDYLLKGMPEEPAAVSAPCLIPPSTMHEAHARLQANHGDSPGDKDSMLPLKATGATEKLKKSLYPTWSLLPMGMTSIIFAGLEMPWAAHSRVLMPIALVAVAISVVAMLSPMLSGSAGGALLKCGKTMANLGMLLLILSGMIFTARTSRIVLTYAEIMAWAGIVVSVFGIVKANIPFKRTSKKVNDNDELAKLMQVVEN